VPGSTAQEKFASILAALSRFAGRPLVMDQEVYASEAATNDRNRGIAHLLDGYGRMYCDPDLAIDVYTSQCSVRVSARDLAVMGATLANGGVNPVTGEQAIDTATASGCWPCWPRPGCMSIPGRNSAAREGPAAAGRDDV